MDSFPDRSQSTRSRRFEIVVDRERARFSTWYELFPRSWSQDPARHGTLADVTKQLSYVADMGFDVLYLPPIHPIGTTFRKGPNNKLAAEPDDPGVPWAIGLPVGGHTAIHPELGTIDDFRILRDTAAEHGLEIALDVAFQCSPDHPWVSDHPEWFRHRPDGSIQHAENPPKKYQDIYPIDFETTDPRAVAGAQRRVRLLDRGGDPDLPCRQPPHQVLRLLGVGRRDQSRAPDVIFLSEAFTRPKVMYRLAKLGFTQSYTYFAWRNTRHELVEYMGDLAAWPTSSDPISGPTRLTSSPSSSDRWPGDVHDPLRAGRHPQLQLRDLRPCLRADGAPTTQPGIRGIPQLEKYQSGNGISRIQTRSPRSSPS